MSRRAILIRKIKEFKQLITNGLGVNFYKKKNVKFTLTGLLTWFFLKKKIQRTAVETAGYVFVK